MFAKCNYSTRNFPSLHWLHCYISILIGIVLDLSTVGAWLKVHIGRMVTFYGTCIPATTNQSELAQLGVHLLHVQHHRRKCRSEPSIPHGGSM